MSTAGCVVIFILGVFTGVIFMAMLYVNRLSNYGE